MLMKVLIILFGLLFFSLAFNVQASIDTKSTPDYEDLCYAPPDNFDFDVINQKKETQTNVVFIITDNVGKYTNDDIENFSTLTQKGIKPKHTLYTKRPGENCNNKYVITKNATIINNEITWIHNVRQTFLTNQIKSVTTKLISYTQIGYSLWN